MKTEMIGLIREVRAGDKSPAFELNEANVDALRAELIRVFPNAQRFLYPKADCVARHGWVEVTTGENGCWLAHAQTAWTNDSWGWQSATPSVMQRRCMWCVPCTLGGWFTLDVVSIGD